MRLDPTTLHLFGDFPREVANPKRTVAKSLEQFLRFLENNNGVNNCYTSVYPLNGVVDKIFYDTDGKGAFPDVCEMYKWLTDQTFSTIPVISGMKGYHLYVLLQSKSYSEPKPFLHSATCGILTKVFGERNARGESVDPHPIGDIRRICRIPNTLRPPLNHNWCTYLPPNFIDMEEAEIALLMKSPFEPEIEDYIIGKLPTLNDLPQAEGFKFTYKPPSPTEQIEVTDQHEFLKKVLRPCLFNKIIQGNPRHHVRVATTVDLLGFFTPNEIFNIFQKLNWTDWNPETALYQIISCKGLIPYSCPKLRELGVPKVCCVG